MLKYIALHSHCHFKWIVWHRPTKAERAKSVVISAYCLHVISACTFTKQINRRFNLKCNHWLITLFFFDLYLVTRNLDTCVLSPDSVQTTLSPEECAEYNQVIGILQLNILWYFVVLLPLLNPGPMVYIFMSQFISGIGTTLFSILGITYLDDNVKRKQTPMLIGKH